MGDLRERASKNDTKGTTYITKGFAQFVAGKALISAGDWAGAKAALKPLVTSSKYELVPVPESVKHSICQAKAMRR